MPVKSILWPFKFRTKVPRVRRWRWTPLSASIIFTIVQNGFFALRTISIYFVLKKFNPISAIRAFNIENCIKTPVLCIISSAFSHSLHPIWQIFCFDQDPALNQEGFLFGDCQFISVHTNIKIVLSSAPPWDIIRISQRNSTCLHYMYIAAIFNDLIQRRKRQHKSWLSSYTFRRFSSAGMPG